MQSSKTTAYIQLLKYWLIAPLLSKESAISKKESAKKNPPQFLWGLIFCAGVPAGFKELDGYAFQRIGFISIYANSVPTDLILLSD